MRNEGALKGASQNEGALVEMRELSGCRRISGNGDKRYPKEGVAWQNEWDW